RAANEVPPCGSHGGFAGEEPEALVDSARLLAVGDFAAGTTRARFKSHIASCPCQSMHDLPCAQRRQITRQIGDSVRRFTYAPRLVGNVEANADEAACSPAAAHVLKHFRALLRVRHPSRPQLPSASPPVARRDELVYR